MIGYAPRDNFSERRMEETGRVKILILPYDLSGKKPECKLAAINANIKNGD